MRATHNTLGAQPPSQDPKQGRRKYLGEALATGIIVTSSAMLLSFVLFINEVVVAPWGLILLPLYLGILGGIQKNFLLSRPRVNDQGGSTWEELREQFLKRTGLFFGVLLFGFVASYPALELQYTIELPIYLIASAGASFAGALCLAAPSAWCRR